jgi:cytochrome P450
VAAVVEDELYQFRGGERWRHPWDDYRRLRDEAPIHHQRDRSHGEFWVLSRFEDVFEAVRDTARFSSADGLTPDADGMAMFEGRAAPIVMMDPPEHTRMRRLVSRPMTPRSVSFLEPAIREFVDRRLDRIADLGECDIVEQLFKPLPSFVVAHFLGVPPDDRDRFDGWTDAIVAASAAGSIVDAPAAAADLFEYAGHLIEYRRAQPGDDLVSALVGAGDEAPTAEWVVGFIFTMVTGGNDTSGNSWSTTRR